MNLDDDLLSHGETPHYHRRCIVSLLSSGWDQVVPMLYGRQENSITTWDSAAMSVVKQPLPAIPAELAGLFDKEELKKYLTEDELNAYSFNGGAK